MPDVTIPAGANQSFSAYLALPEKTPAPALILIQEIFGVNREMREKCDAMAAQGYVTICPDLFWRIEPGIRLSDQKEEELQRAFDLFGQFDTEKGLRDLKTTLDFIRKDKSCAGKVGCMGYCLGGKLAYMMAAQTDIDAAVGYYGVAIDTMLDQARNIKNPLLLHIAGADEFVPPAAQEKIKNALKPHPQITIYEYPDMEHAFARGGGLHYNEKAARLANERSTAFLAATLKQAKAA